MYQFSLTSEIVEIKDGPRLVVRLLVSQATYAEDMTKASLEMQGAFENQQDAKKRKVALSASELQFQYFRKAIYPKLAACSKVVDEAGKSPLDALDGSIDAPEKAAKALEASRLPTVTEVWGWPSNALDLWYGAAVRVNPGWFDEFKQIAEQAIKALEKLPADHPDYQELKKKEPRRRVSSRHSAKR